MLLFFLKKNCFMQQPRSHGKQTNKQKNISEKNKTNKNKERKAFQEKTKFFHPYKCHRLLLCHNSFMNLWMLVLLIYFHFSPSHVCSKLFIQQQIIFCRYYYPSTRWKIEERQSLMSHVCFSWVCRDLSLSEHLGILNNSCSLPGSLPSLARNTSELGDSDSRHLL